jgi:hypothetical protein
MLLALYPVHVRRTSVYISLFSSSVTVPSSTAQCSVTPCRRQSSSRAHPHGDATPSILCICQPHVRLLYDVPETCDVLRAQGEVHNTENTNKPEIIACRS